MHNVKACEGTTTHLTHRASLLGEIQANRASLAKKSHTVAGKENHRGWVSVYEVQPTPEWLCLIGFHGVYKDCRAHSALVFFLFCFGLVWFF